MVTDCVQMDLKFSIIQSEQGLSELNQGLPGKNKQKTDNFFLCEKKIMLSWSQTHLLQLIQSVMYRTRLDYNYFQGTGISIITFLYNGQMQLPHFAVI